MTDLPLPQASIPAIPPHQNVNVRYYLAVAALVVLCTVVYWPALHGGAIWDDNESLVDNHNLRDVQGLADTVIQPMSLKVYYPMTFVTFWIEHKLFGLNPNDLFPYHVTNLALQILDAWLLWEILRRLKVPGAWLIAAIWAIHPVQVESVAWVSERKNTLSAFFLFISVAIWLRFVGLDPIPPALKEGEEEPLFALPRDRKRLYLLSLVFFALALLSKSAVIFLPATLLLILWWKRGRLIKQDWIESIPYFVLAIAMGITTFYVETHHTGASGADYQLAFGQRLSIAGRAIWFYPAKLFWPQPLSFVYHRWQPSSPIGWIGALAAIAIIGALWQLRDRVGRSPLTAILFLAFTLFPILGFFPFVFQIYSFVADHLQYLACIGLIALVVVGLRKLIVLNGIFAAVGTVILLVLGALSWQRSHLYQNVELIWRDVLVKDPDSWMAYNNLGSTLIQKGDPASLAEAAQLLNRAIDLNPKFVQSRHNLALLYEKRSDIPKTMELLKVAQQVSESNPIHTAADADVYYDLGRMYKIQGDQRAALHAFHTAYVMDMNNFKASNAIAGMLLENGEDDRAAQWIDRTLQIDSEYLPAHTNLGNLYAARGNVPAAMQEWTYVLSRDKDDVFALDSVGRLMAEMQNWDQAILWFNKALAVDPNFQPAKQHLIAATRHKLEAATRPTTRSTTRSTTQSTTRSATQAVPSRP